MRGIVLVAVMASGVAGCYPPPRYDLCYLSWDRADKSYAYEPIAVGPPLRTAAVDVYVDTLEQPLAGYEIEVAGDRGRLAVTGVEGGDPMGFSDPPACRTGPDGKTVISASCRGQYFPVGKTRVARLSIRMAGSDPPRWHRVRLRHAAAPDGERLQARLVLSRGDAR